LGDISSDLSADIGQFIGWYFKYRPFFCCKRYGEWFLHIVSATSKKGDIGRYLGRIGRYLKQGNWLEKKNHNDSQNIFTSIKSKRAITNSI